jgi:predicted TIM-barrel fold metal-dependent hydrolase
MSTATHTSPSAARVIRESLDHPIVDSDGHVLEVLPVFAEYLADLEGAPVADYFRRSGAYVRYATPWAATDDERAHVWMTQNNLWGHPTKNTLDRATATIPGLYARRMDDLGIDFSILYPSGGLALPGLPDPDRREAIVRAYNRWVMELCAPHPTRMLPAAVIPMETPDEAIRHLRYAVEEIGHRVVCLQGYALRPIPAVEEVAPGTAGLAGRVDYFGLDSPYDYDAVWQACLDLKVAPTFHSPTGLRGGRSISNYTYNHIGSIAQAQEGLAKSLFLAGVTRRFPTLNFGFLECGAGWACALYADLVGHYEKRNRGAMEYVDPTKLDVDALMGYFEEYSDDYTRRHLDTARAFYDREHPPIPDRDDFWRVGLSSKDEIEQLFVPRFYIGCEADDRSVAWAFDSRINPYGSKLRAMFGSDVGHWDVTDVGDVVVEAKELVDDGFITESDFKAFMYLNPVELHAGVNPGFFRNTVVEDDVERFLASGRA